MSGEREEILIRGTTVNRTSDDDIEVTLYPEGMDMRTDAIHVVLPVGVALDLLQTLVTQAVYAVKDVSASVAAGDCPICRNIRLVDAEAPGGRTQRVHCPECRPAFDEAHRHPFARPRIGGGVS